VTTAFYPFRVPSGPDGVELAGVRFGAGPPLVLLHALGFSKRYWAHAADVLGAHFTCVAFDQRGHGETALPEGAPITPEACAQDVRQVLDYLGIPRAAVGGTSLGALSALLFALREPERVSVLVQDLPAYGPRSPRHPRRSEPVARALDRGDFEEAARRAARGLQGAPFRALQSALLENWGRYPVASFGPRLARAFRATARWRPFPNWPAELAALRVPTRVLALRGDPFHPYEIAESIARTAPGARLHSRVPALAAPAVANQWIQVIREALAAPA
jgi:pimeloyl-ACP methyl ester carboxylesterase